MEVEPSFMGKKKDGLILGIQYFPSIYVLSKSNELLDIYETSLSISPAPSLANP